MRANARPVDTMVQIERALRDPGRRSLKSIGVAFRRKVRLHKVLADSAAHTIKTGGDIEHQLDDYLRLMASMVLGQSLGETVIDLLDLQDETLLALMRHLPPARREPFINRLLGTNE